MHSPVMPLARSESRKAAVLPTSSALTPRRSGEFFSTKFRIFEKPPMPAAASVLIGPAEIAFTRLPDAPGPALAHAFALVGKGEHGAFAGARLGDAVGDRAVGEHSRDEDAPALQEAHFVVPSP